MQFAKLGTFHMATHRTNVVHTPIGLYAAIQGVSPGGLEM